MKSWEIEKMLLHEDEPVNKKRNFLYFGGCCRGAIIFKTIVFTAQFVTAPSVGNLSPDIALHRDPTAKQGQKIYFRVVQEFFIVFK